MKNKELTKENILEIKKAYNRKNDYGKAHNPRTNISYRMLAEKYNMSHTTIASVVCGEYDYLIAGHSKTI